MTVRIVHNKVTLALHPLRDAHPSAGPRSGLATDDGDAGANRIGSHALRGRTGPEDGDGSKASAARPLLILHGLGERTPDAAPAWTDPWPGPVWGLDLTGHGASTMSRGGGYTAEILMADVTRAIEHLGEVTLLGRGLGAYVALLAAGARAEQVRGAILADGPGLVGGGPAPASPMMLSSVGLPPGPPDPFAVIELSRDVRPPDYATRYAAMAAERSGLDQPITVVARVRPPWLAAVVDRPGVGTATLDEAFARHSP